MSTSTATEPGARFVGEGVVPPSAYQLRPWTAQTALTVALIVVLAGAAVVLDHLFVGGVLGVLAVIAVSTRLVPELRYARARRAGHDFTQRFEIDAEGILHTWYGADGTRHEKTYEWFLFESVQAEPHRLILCLRVPTRPGSTYTEVLLVPRSLFEQDYAELTALVEAHVKKPVVQAAPRDPNASIKTFALWFALVLSMVAVYYFLRARGG